MRHSGPRLRRLLVCVAGAVVLAQVGVTSANADSGTGSSPAQAMDTSACTPLPVVGTRYVGPDGSTLAPESLLIVGRQAAKVTQYALPDGETMTTTVPPSGFIPSQASDATLNAFGFTPPTDPARAADWRNALRTYTGTVETRPCINPTIHHADNPSGNWAGVVAGGHTNFVEVYDDQNIPTYSSTCGTTSANTSHWIGIGGSSAGHGLLQQGFDASYSSLNGAEFWWEAITAAGHDNGSVYVAHSTATGHVISEYMVYTPSNHTTTFHWYDRTSGTQYNPATFSSASYNGSPYYSGNSADWITERLGGSPMRKFSTSQFTAAGAEFGTTFANMGNYSYNRDHIVNGSGNTLVDTGSGLLSTSSVNMFWRRCS